MEKLVLTLLLLPAIVVGQSSKQQEYSYKVNEGQKIILDLQHASNIDIKGYAGQELVIKTNVQINSGQNNDAFSITKQERGNQLELKTELDKDKATAVIMQSDSCDGSRWYYSGDRDGGYGICLKVEFEILVPQSQAIELKTISADIVAANLLGSTSLKSISGFIDYTWPKDRAGQVSLKSVTGELYSNLPLEKTSAKKDYPIVGYQWEANVGKLASSTRQKLALETISSNIYLRQ